MANVILQCDFGDKVDKSGNVTENKRLKLELSKEDFMHEDSRKDAWELYLKKRFDMFTEGSFKLEVSEEGEKITLVLGK